MIKLIQSDKVQLPIVYLVETQKDLETLPLGVPFIRGKENEYNNCVQMLEFEVLWKSMIESNFKFKWKDILARHGFYNTWKYGVARSSGCPEITMSDKDWREAGKVDSLIIDENNEIVDCSTFLNEISYKVNIDVIKELKLLPSWLDDIEKAISENILNSVTYNPTLYTKKLGLPLGGVEFNTAKRNLIIIDISGSIPDGVAGTMLSIAKTLVEQFYADIVITGGKSVLYEYDKVDKLDTTKMFKELGRNNDQEYFVKLLSEPRKYKTAIVFGDNDYPGIKWSKRDKDIEVKEGKELCKWEIDEIISFHTHDHKKIAGYGRWFNTTNVTHIDNWVTDMN